MKEHIAAFKASLEAGQTLDYLKNSGYKFEKQELIDIAAELLYTAYQEATDEGCLPEEEQKQNYQGFVRRFINNMNEFECGFFDDRGGVLETHVFGTLNQDMFRALHDVDRPQSDQDEAKEWNISIEDYIRIVTKNCGTYVVKYDVGHEKKSDTFFYNHEEALAALEELRECSRN